MEKKDIKKPEKKEVEAVDQYPGVQPDVADNEKVNDELSRQDTRMLNNNPRNSDM